MTWDFLDARETLSQSGSQLASEWDLLNGILFNEHPLLSHAFVGPMIRHFGSRKLLVGRLRRNRETGALMLIQPRHTGLWQTFLPGQAPIAPALAGKNFDARSLLHALPGFAIAIDFLCQDPLFSFSASDHATDCREQQRYCTTTAVSLDTTFDEYWGRRPKNLRKNMKRYLGKADESGKVASLRLITNPVELPAALDRYGLLESAGWKGKAGTAIHPSNEQGRFYADVLSNFAAFNGSRIYELYLGDHLSASRLCIARGGMLVVLKTTYDEALSNLAPGRLLLYELLAHEFREREFSTIEFYTNASQDSISWATGTREICHQSYYRHAAIKRFVSGTRVLRHAFSRHNRPPSAPPQSSPPPGPDPPDSPH